MTERLFAFDTNVIVSAALLPDSVPRRAVEAALDAGRLILSGTVLDELASVLRRKRLDKYASEEKRLRFLAALSNGALLVHVTEVIAACRDPKDNKLLELAVGGRATCLVSGDLDLLVLNPFRGIPIVTPREFLGQSWTENSAGIPGPIDPQTGP